jgi:type I restriction enzyme S subunit
MVLSDLPKGRALAKCYFVNSDNSFTVNQRVCKLSKSRINSRLLCYLLDRHPFLLAFDDGLNQTHLSKENVRRCPIVFPSSPIEQSKIADTLFALEDLIAVQAQKVDGLKAHKKGLMQQLFPSTDEVHG